MSSHHIVRENQEPALLVASISALDEEHLGQLLEWSPSILTDDYHVDFLLAEAIKVDIVFSTAAKGYDQDSIKHIALKADFMEEALGYLIAHNYAAVNIVCDQIEAAHHKFCKDINIVLFLEGRWYVFVAEGYKKWKPKGEQIFVAENLLASYVGLDRVNDSVFITNADGFVELTFNTADFVLVGENI